MSSQPLDQSREGTPTMPRHAHYVPHGVIPAVLLPFFDDLSIDEQSFRKHLRDVAATDGISAITINAHSTEVASCSFEEQRRVLAIAEDEIGGRLALGNGTGAGGGDASPPTPPWRPARPIRPTRCSRSSRRCRPSAPSRTGPATCRSTRCTSASCRA